MKYPLALRILHWLLAALILGMIALGLYMTGLARTDPSRAELFALHKSIGITILFLAPLRLALRLRLGTPALPALIPAREAMLAHLGHYAFYVFMFAIPLSGYVLTNSFGLSVKWFGVTLPRLFSVDKATGELAADFHAYAAYTLLGVVALHVAGVIKHLLKERVNLLQRMI